MVVFFHITCAGWLLFAVHDLGDVPLLLQKAGLSLTARDKIGLVSMAVFALPLLAAEWQAERAGETLVAINWRRPVRVAVYAWALFLIFLCGWRGQNEFIYFQF